MIDQIARSAVTKFLETDGLIIENVVSEGNVGPGLWLDSHNTGFIIRNNVLKDNSGSSEGWEGPGLWIENNPRAGGRIYGRSEEHTSELQSLMRNSYAVFCLKKKIKRTYENTYTNVHLI